MKARLILSVELAALIKDGAARASDAAPDLDEVAAAGVHGDQYGTEPQYSPHRVIFCPWASRTWH